MSMNGPQTPYSPELPDFSSDENIRFWGVLKQLREKQIVPNQLPSILGNRDTFERFKQYGTKVNPMYNQFRANEDKLSSLVQQDAQLKAQSDQLEQNIKNNREQSILKAIKTASI